jgi:activator of 2-hydroxyglutaryl-CoA dehydratase
LEERGGANGRAMLMVPEHLILGIDPGSTDTGLALVHKDRILDTKSIKRKKGQSLYWVAQEIASYATTNGSTVCAMDSWGYRYQGVPKAARQQEELRNLITLELAAVGLAVVTVFDADSKKTITDREIGYLLKKSNAHVRDAVRHATLVQYNLRMIRDYR